MIIVRKWLRRFWIDRAKVGPGIDARVMSVGKTDAEGIRSDQFCIECLQGAFTSGCGGQHGERIALKFFPQFTCFS
jgi:hypothetical protein